MAQGIGAVTQWDWGPLDGRNAGQVQCEGRKWSPQCRKHKQNHVKIKKSKKSEAKVPKTL